MNIRATLGVTAASTLLLTGLTACTGDTQQGAQPIDVSSASRMANSPSATPGSSMGQSSGTAASGAASTSALASSSATTGQSAPSATHGSGTSSTSPSTTTNPTTAPTRSCAPQTSGAAAQNVVHALPPLTDLAWEVFDGDNHYDPCAALSYIVVGIHGATGSSPYHIALYHHGAYLGTATKVAYGFHPQVTRTADNAVRVEYIYPKGGECNACATGRANAAFRWDDAAGHVVMTGSVPPAP